MTLAPAEIDLSDPAFWAAPPEARDAAFAALRAARPIAFFAERPNPTFGAGPGYWALTRHADVVDASRRPDLFSSARGIHIPDMPPEILEFTGSMINMDDPRHTRLRRIVSRGFTPKTLDGLRTSVEQIARQLVDAVAERGECDFVTDVAAPLPLRIILDLMGIPRSEERFVFDRTNVIIGAGDPEYGPTDPAAIGAALISAATDLVGLVSELGEHRMREPGDDVITALVTADVDGERLSAQELGSFFILLLVAGNESTRNSIAHGLLALTEQRDQWERWRTDVDGLTPTAVEEIVRWASPAIHMRRTVTTDGVRLGDHGFAAGDKVVLWYCSANRDDAAFDEPFRFDVGRTPNEHVGFGGPGPHFCLGAHLARREMAVLFKELLRRLPDLHAAGPPDRLHSNFVNGIKHLRAEFTPAP